MIVFDYVMQSVAIKFQVNPVFYPVVILIRFFHKF